MPQPDEIRQKLKKKRSRELRAYFFDIAQKEGFGAAISRTFRYLKRRYAPKKGRYLPKKAVLDRQRQTDTTGWPLLSVCVPVYNPAPQHFAELLQSLEGQTYPNWELCLANASDGDSGWMEALLARHTGGRIQRRRIENRGIAENTNLAVSLAKGSHIIFADHDDVLAPQALFEVARHIVEYDPPLLYSDEALFSENWLYPSAGHFKPHYSPQYLLSVNYIGHLVAVRRDIWQQVGGLRSAYDGAQDHDFLLRALEITGAALHIPRVLYYWRQHAESTSTGVEAKPYVAEAAKRAIRDHLQRIGRRGRVVDGLFPSTYKVYYDIASRPLVSIIIPSCDHIPDLDRCIRSIGSRTRYLQYEVIVAENNSQMVETFSYYQELAASQPRCKVAVYEEAGFNFSKICNFGRQNAKGQYLLFLNNDTEVISPEWLEEMLGLCQLEEVGVVGALLYYPDDSVQHAGVVTGLGGFAGHSHKYARRGHSGYMFRQACVQEVSAVTGACLMVKAALFDELNGFDEGFPVAYNDVDFCLRAGQAGQSVVFTPYAELYHHESKSRGSDEAGEAKERFAAEQERLLARHGEALLSDPFYNPNLTRDREDFSESDILPD